MARALKNLNIHLGLATIPVQLFTATSSMGLASHLLHAKCGSRIQMRLECPIHGIVPREETVRGYEIAKDEYVPFEPEELKALEQASTSALVIAGQEIERVEVETRRPGRNTPGEPRTERTGEGGCPTTGAEGHGSEAARTSAPRVIASGIPSLRKRFHTPWR
jgi:Ku70/Ku80 beta-barrel domain